MFVAEIKAFFDKIIGVPGVGIHSYRIFDIAYMDVIVVLIGSIFLAWIMKWNYFRTIIGMFVFGIVVHRLLDVRSTVDKWLFPA
jgi:hypothetical protein